MLPLRHVLCRSSFQARLAPEVMIRQARTGHWHRKSYIYRKLKPINYSNRAGLVAYLPLLRVRLAGRVQLKLFNLWRRMLAGGQQSG